MSVLESRQAGDFELYAKIFPVRGVSAINTTDEYIRLLCILIIFGQLVPCLGHVIAMWAIRSVKFDEDQFPGCQIIKIFCCEYG